MMAMHLTHTRGSSLTLDCQGILKVVTGSLERGLSPKNKWASYYRDLRVQAGWGCFQAFHKAKSHRTFESVGDGPELRAAIRANRYADLGKTGSSYASGPT